MPRDPYCLTCQEPGIVCATHDDVARQSRIMADRFTLELEAKAETKIREIVREEIAIALRERDTIPAPFGESHSGAVVVPRGSSNPPGYMCEAIVGLYDGRPVSMRPGGAVGFTSTESVVDLPGSCAHCRMLACVCGVVTDGSNGEGGL